MKAEGAIGNPKTDGHKHEHQRSGGDHEGFGVQGDEVQDRADAVLICLRTFKPLRCRLKAAFHA